MLCDDKNGSKVITVTEYESSRDEYRSAEGDTGTAVKYDPASFIHQKDRTYIDMRGAYGHDVSILAEKIIERAD